MLTFTYDGINIKLYQNKILLQELPLSGTIDNYGQVNFENLVINKLNNKYNGAQYES